MLTAHPPLEELTKLQVIRLSRSCDFLGELLCMTDLQLDTILVEIQSVEFLCECTVDSYKLKHIFPGLYHRFIQKFEVGVILGSQVVELDCQQVLQIID